MSTTWLPALYRAGIPFSKKPFDLSTTDCKRGQEPLWWRNDPHPLAGRQAPALDITAVRTSWPHPFNFLLNMKHCGENAREKRHIKYHELSMTYTFISIACEALNTKLLPYQLLPLINTKVLPFLAELGRRIALDTGDPGEGAFLFFITEAERRPALTTGSVPS